ncbi:TPA: FtsH protease activity modulator HflK [Candidatus Poribacteria bacterium]|nr:FtsH protease activity modulator HflK [Candidatus Poribacteria bacterium]
MENPGILDGIESYISKFDPKSTSKLVFWIFIALIVLIAASTCFYTVKADEQALILRFGKHVDTTNPGLHFKLPFGIDKKFAVPVKQIFKAEFGFRTHSAGVRTQYDPNDQSQESLLLTGDLNIADVEWVVQYQIADPLKFLFSIRKPVAALRDLSESVTSLVVGDRTVTNVLTVGRASTQNDIEERLKQKLAEYNTGLRVVEVFLQEINPPETVKPAFNAVNEAKQEKEKLINEALKEYNQVVPKASGLAKKLISEAEGYALQRVNEAKGDADRFNAIRAQYNKAKEVTKKRLYLETMSKILPSAKEVYIIDDKSNKPIPILQLGQ